MFDRLGVAGLPKLDPPEVSVMKREPEGVDEVAGVGPAIMAS